MPFPASVTVTLTPEKAYAGYNRNSLRVVVEPASGPLEIWFKLRIPYINEGTAFLARDDERPTATAQSSADSARQVIPISREGAWELEPWQKAMKVAVGEQLVLTAENLHAATEPGVAEVTLSVQINGQSVESKTWKIAVEKREGGTRIHTFVADPGFVLHGGEQLVTLKWKVAPDDANVKLSKNNVVVWDSRLSEQRRSEFEDRPSFTSSYRLIAESRDDDVLATAQTAVQVAQPGWNQQALPQGYPTLLLPMKGSDGSPVLYAICIGANGDASLWWSASGFADWQRVNVPFPQQMKESPGIVFAGKLWLIGGSAVNPDEMDRQVWSYDPLEKRWTQEKTATLPEPRMGHTCAAFAGKIWVMGGLSRNMTTSDLLSYDGNAWSTHKAQWPPRCMSAAVVTPPFGQFSATRLWICGGKRAPDETAVLSDIWWSENGRDWKQLAQTSILADQLGAPIGATLLFDDGLLLAGTFLRGDAILSSHLLKFNEVTSVWEDHPVSFGWEQFGGAPFLLQSLVFNRFYFLWSIAASRTSTRPKLNIFIP